MACVVLTTVTDWALMTVFSAPARLACMPTGNSEPSSGTVTGPLLAPWTRPIPWSANAAGRAVKVSGCPDPAPCRPLSRMK
jgi:hypothetical protein